MLQGIVRLHGGTTCSWEFQQKALDGLGVQQQLLTASLPNLAAAEDGLKEAWRQAVGQLVAEEAEVVLVQGRPHLGPQLAQGLAEAVHKV